ncbi:DUF6444 domain-containing protein [Fimbriiglobus ruber]|uniref:DUF6444 domain-containing protein n=1 Tax=Fimbriiglobus ruber TaxID=1908690 RepID=A0A225DR72_9BACT|nr:DUF6444 domain-containing protein [Fimbriiglobus ruber]OWK41118.1 hypothetical protein FRUB_05010 [Fimbriiglobus ruber]
MFSAMTRPPSISEDQWATFPAAGQALIATLLAEIAQLKVQVAHLQQRLDANSTNSHRPPSSDPPHTKPAPPRRPSGKTRGGQPEARADNSPGRRGHRPQADTLRPLPTHPHR